MPLITPVESRAGESHTKGSCWVTDFVCEVDEHYRSACADLPEYQDTGYCVLHFPGEDKKDDSKRILESKLAQKDYDFSGAVFPEGTADFKEFGFDADTSFSGARFVGSACFSKAKFHGDASFAGAKFYGERTDFRAAEFFAEEPTNNFRDTEFGGGETTFRETRFSAGTAWLG
jgi:hypothetical protein